MVQNIGVCFVAHGRKTVLEAADFKKGMGVKKKKEFRNGFRLFGVRKEILGKSAQEKEGGKKKKNQKGKQGR